MHVDKHSEVLSYLKFWLTDWKLWALLFINSRLKYAFSYEPLCVYFSGTLVLLSELMCETDKSDFVCTPLFNCVGMLEHTSLPSLCVYVCACLNVLMKFLSQLQWVTLTHEFWSTFYWISPYITVCPFMWRAKVHVTCHLSIMWQCINSVCTRK